jgi:hypothetical protein
MRTRTVPKHRAQTAGTSPLDALLRGLASGTDPAARAWAAALLCGERADSGELADAKAVRQKEERRNQR